jgi:hypothetical protein
VAAVASEEEKAVVSGGCCLNWDLVGKLMMSGKVGLDGEWEIGGESRNVLEREDTAIEFILKVCSSFVLIIQSVFNKQKQKQQVELS